jgi:hypothetical protein
MLAEMEFPHFIGLDPNLDVCEFARIEGFDLSNRAASNMPEYCTDANLYIDDFDTSGASLLEHQPRTPLRNLGRDRDV